MAGPLDKELCEAAFVCDFVRVRDLLAAGADPNARDEDGRTPLFSAVLGNSVGLIGLLLESGADVNAADQDGYSVLHFAAQENLPVIARLLLGRGADPNQRDGDGATPLWRAVQSAREDNEMIEILRAGGAKDDIANYAGETARDLAERLGNPIFGAN